MQDTIFYQDNFLHHLSKADFRRLSELIQTQVGIKMPWSKMSMVESRLRKRLRRLQIPSFTEYCEYLFSTQGMKKELTHFINVITTNKTDFFREPNHFEFLVQKAVPDLISILGSGFKRKLTVWSAACSKGNEAYTIAMVLSEFAARYPGLAFDFTILATDISTNVLDEAQLGIYDRQDIEPVPSEFRKKYFLKSKDRHKRLVRVVPELRNKVKYRQLNLMDEDFRFREPMDIIFCRNVIIYFNKDTQDNLILRLCRYLKHEGYLFMGHSEVIHCQGMPLVSVAPAVYKKV